MEDFKKEAEANRRRQSSPITLKTDGKGSPVQTIENFLTVLDKDGKFADLKFNELSYSPERLKDGKVDKWTDADDAATKNYLEKEYGLYHNQKFEDAMRIKFTKK